MAGTEPPIGEEPRGADGVDADRWTRRRLLRVGGLGGTLLLGGAATLRLPGEAPAAAEPAYGPDTDAGAGGHGTDHGAHDLHDELAAIGVRADGYGHGPAPPRDLDDATVRALTHPPAADENGAETSRHYELPVTAERVAIADGVTIDGWVYGGRVPGPVLRATEGDRIHVEVANRTDMAHNLHTHGAHDPQMDGWEPIPPGESFTYELDARPTGLHPYHCHVPPLAEHVRRGLYGAMIVDPPGGRQPALEVMLILGGFDVDGDGRNELYAFNGVCGLYDRHPIQVPVGELVRVYVINMVEGEPVAGLHLHAETFDVYRSGTSTTPDEHTDQVTLAQGDRAVLEFRLPTRGRYMFHPHQHHMAERGAMGWFTAV